jgi:hypothetical protein
MTHLCREAREAIVEARFEKWSRTWIERFHGS